MLTRSTTNEWPLSVVDAGIPPGSPFWPKTPVPESISRRFLAPTAPSPHSAENFPHVPPTLSGPSDVSKSLFWESSGHPASRPTESSVGVWVVHGLSARPSRLVESSRVDLQLAGIALLLVFPHPTIFTSQYWTNFRSEKLVWPSLKAPPCRPGLSCRSPPCRSLVQGTRARCVPVHDNGSIPHFPSSSHSVVPGAVQMALVSAPIASLWWVHPVFKAKLVQSLLRDVNLAVYAPHRKLIIIRRVVNRQLTDSKSSFLYPLATFVPLDKV